VDFRTFMEQADYSEETKKLYSLYERLVPEGLTQESLDALILSRKNPTFRSFLRVYIYDFLKRHDLHIARRRGHRRRVYIKYLSREEVESILKSDVEPRVKLFTRLALETGFRVSEILKINRFVLMYGRVTGKGNVESDITVSSGLRRDLLEAADRRGVIFGVKRNTMWRKFNNIGRKMFGRGISPHDLRRTYGIRRRGEGKDLFAVSKELRHTNVATTQRYFDVPEDEIRRKGWWKDV
jgi:integrase